MKLEQYDVISMRDEFIKGLCVARDELVTKMQKHFEDEALKVIRSDINVIIMDFTDPKRGTELSLFWGKENANFRALVSAYHDLNEVIVKLEEAFET